MSDLGKDIRSALLTARHVAHNAENAASEGRAAGGGIEQVLPLIAGAAPAIGNALQSKANGFAEGGSVVDKAQNTEQPATIPARQNPNFQKWFAGSKVVNGQGQPDTLYHGTAGDFDTFKQKRNDVGMHFGTIGQANDRLSYQRDRGVKTEAGMNLMPVHLAIRNPLRMQDLGNWDGNGLAWALAKEFPEQAKWIALNVRTPKQARDFLQSKGHDGIVYKNTGEVGGSEPYREEIKAATQELHKHFPKNKNSFDHTDQMHPAYQAWASAHDKYREHRENNAEDSYIAFHPTQVKSAIGNSGNFDPKDPSIVRAGGGPVTLRAAGVMLRDPEDRVLFVKRNPKGGDHGGEWAFPGGKIEHGETPATAAARDTHEELGHRITSRLGEPVHVRVSKEGVHFTTFEHRVPKQFTPKLNDEHSEHRWAHPNSAPAPLHPGAKATLEKLAKKSPAQPAEDPVRKALNLTTPAGG